MSRHESTTLRMRDLFYGSVIAVSIACTGSLISLAGANSIATSAGSATPMSIAPSATLATTSTTGITAGSAGSAASADNASAVTPVAEHGALSVQGTGLVDASGAPFQLRGVSTHGLLWVEDYVGSAAFATQQSDMGANSIRLELYTGEYGGQVNGTTPAELLDQVNDGVNAATRAGLYTVIDWHVLNNGNPLSNVSEARDFFGTVSERYGAQDNVIYEICNESASSVPWSHVRSYAEDIIATIRANDPDAVVIVGTPVGEGATGPITQPLTGAAAENVLYGIDAQNAVSAGQGLDERLASAIADGLPVYVSEYGEVESALAPEEGGASWLARADENHVSFACGSLSDRDEAADLVEHGGLASTDRDVLDASNYNDGGSWDRACLRDTLGLM